MGDAMDPELQAVMDWLNGMQYTGLLQVEQDTGVTLPSLYKYRAGHIGKARYTTIRTLQRYAGLEVKS